MPHYTTFGANNWDLISRIKRIKNQTRKNRFNINDLIKRNFLERSEKNESNSNEPRSKEKNPIKP